ncbi:oleate hydratase [Clostridium pasteurianum]|nr:oleate hydratase [Clostridium pasteurianum]PJI07611.1 oleate hydratase [Clostridium sp. CT7]
MKNYDRIHARKPEGIENRHAFIVGGGIAGLSAAAFLAEDGYMPGRNITIYEQLPVVGGSMDGSGNAIDGYVSRGERELEPYMECLWYLFGMVPSLEEDGRTVLDETRECNKNLPIYAKKRLFENQFNGRDISSLGITKADIDNMMKMMSTPENEIEDVTIEQWYTKDFFKSNLWYYWSSMLAFQPYHSLIEMKRYTVRFMQHLDGVENLKGILRTKYDQYNSLIKPLHKWLEDKGVNFITDTTVDEIHVEINGEKKTVTYLGITKNCKCTHVPVSANDLVYFTNGSMTQNSSHGDNKKVAVMDRDLEYRGCFSVWEKLAKVSPVFGKPEKFISAPDKSHFISYTVTIKDYPKFFEYVEKRTTNVTGTAGAITLVDSAWFQSINMPPQPVFPDQPENVQVFWGYGLKGNEVGDYIKKPMKECTGEEILQELLYHLDYIDKYEEMLPHAKIITTMMPYITSQFMPRGLHDRPQIIPKGCTNLAFIGQFVELEGDVVFTVETSVRTAMIAVYRTLQLDKPIMPLFEANHDIRIIVACLKKMLGVETITKDELPAMNPLKLPKMIDQLLKGINSVPKMKDYYPEIDENAK